jgi:hypothetical protein
LQEDIELGGLVLARDENSSVQVELAEVSKITEDTLILACYGTRGKSPKTAKLYQVYTHGTDVYLGKHPKKVAAKRWTWKIKIQDINDLLPAPKIE